MSDKKKKEIPIWFGIFCIIIFLLFVVRSFFSINTTDEVFNIGESFRTVLGNSFLTENWDFFQTGDSFLYPFLKLFYIITGSSDGIVLFSRFAFIIVNSVFGILSYNLLKNTFGKLNSLIAVLVYYTDISFKFFVLTYDITESLFQTICLIALFCYYNRCNSISLKQRICLLLAVVASQALMVYSYPTTITVVLYSFCLLVFCNKTPDKVLKRVLLYIGGIMIVFIPFVILTLTKGIDNLFIFNNVASESGLSDRQYIFTISGIIYSCMRFVWRNFHLFFSPCIIWFISSIISFIFRNKKYTIISIVFFMILGSLALIKERGIDTTNIADHIMTYISFYSFSTVWLISKEKRENIWQAILFIQIPSYFAGFSVALTALGGALKFSNGAKTAVIVASLCVCEVIKERFTKTKTRNFLISTVGILFLIMNLIIVYASAFQGTAPIQCSTRFNSGIYKGIYDTEEIVSDINSFENNLNSIIDENDKTITFGNFLIFGYLETDLKPNTNYLWNPGTLFKNENGENRSDYKTLEAYYEKHYGYADIFVLKSDEAECKSEDFMTFINKNYSLSKQSDEYLFYRLKENK